MIIVIALLMGLLLLFISPFIVIGIFLFTIEMVREHRAKKQYEKLNLKSIQAT